MTRSLECSERKFSQSVFDNAFGYLGDEFSRLEAMVGSAMRVFDPEVQERAFGAPGEPGDPVRIENLARHVINSYEAILDWAAGLRAVVPPDELKRAFDLTARMANAPIVQFRDFVDDVVRQMARIADHMAGDKKQPLVIEAALVLKIDEEVLAEFSAEMDRLRRFA